MSEVRSASEVNTKPAAWPSTELRSLIKIRVIVKPRALGGEPRYVTSDDR
jgi:hypothetical protein